MIITQIEAQDLASQLAKEMVTSYEAEDATVSAIVTALLNFQVLTPAITVGTISGDYSSLTRSIKVDGDRLLRALFRLRDTVGGYIYVDNDRKLQWASSLGEDKGQQIRYRKNLKGIEREIDYSKLFNRIYAYGEGEGTARIKLSDADGQEEDYVEDTDSQEQWGGIYPGVFVDRSITHPDTLLAWANLLIADYKNPPVYYRVDTADLSESEEYDFSFEALQLGSTITVIDEDLGIDVAVKVVKIEHPDLLNPHLMVLELANRTKDITDTLTEVYDRQQFDHHIATVIGAGQVIVKGTFTVLDWATGGETTIRGDYITTGTINLTRLDFMPLSSSGETGEVIATINATAEGIKISADKIEVGAGVTIFKQDGIPTSTRVGDLWFDTNDHNKLYRAACVGADEIKAGEWELVRDTQISTNTSSISVNTNNISINVTNINTLDGKVTTNEGNISVNADNISIEVTNRINGDTTLEGLIDVNADNITLEVTNRTNADSTLQGQITVNAGNITLKVSKNDVIHQINISTEGIKIQSDNITLDGVVAVTDDIKSSNYSAGSAGWIINGDGSAEFNDVTVRGTVYATAGEFAGTLKASNIEAGETLTVNGAISAGGGKVIIDSGGITIDDNTSAEWVKFKFSGSNTGKMYASSTTFTIGTYGSSGKHLRLIGDGNVQIWCNTSTITIEAQTDLILSSSNGQIILNDEILIDADMLVDENEAYRIGTADFHHDYIWSERFLEASHCEEIAEPLEAVMNLRATSEYVTLEDRVSKHMSRSIQKKLESAGHGLTIFRKDKSTFPPELLEIPTQEDNEQAMEHYERSLERYNEKVKQGKEAKKPWLPEPQIGISIGSQIWLLVRAMQEFVLAVNKRLDKLESKS